MDAERDAPGLVRRADAALRAVHRRGLVVVPLAPAAAVPSRLPGVVAGRERNRRGVEPAEPPWAGHPVHDVGATPTRGAAGTRARWGDGRDRR